MQRDDIKPGMRVKIARETPSYDDGWNNSWTEEMDGYVGNSRIYTVEYVGQNGVRLAEDHDFNWPWQSLELATEPQVQKEPVMSLKPLFETKTYIRGREAISITSEELIDTIREAEAEIASLGAIKTESKHIAKQIAGLKAQLTLVVKELDGRK